MTNFNVMGEHYNPKMQTVNLTTTQRPIGTNVQTVCSPDGYLQFGIDSQRVDQCVANLMGAMDGYKSDEIVAAIGITFTLIVDRFQLHLVDYLQFIRNFMQADDYKLGCISMQRFLYTCFQEQLTRFVQVNFKSREIRF